MDSLDRPLVDAPDAFRASVQAEARRRLTICALALVVAAVVAVLPVPSLQPPQSPFGNSLMVIAYTSIYESMGMTPWAFRSVLGGGWGSVLYAVVPVAAVLAHPILVHQFLGLVAARRHPGRRRLLLAAGACLGSFAFGVVAGFHLLTWELLAPIVPLGSGWTTDAVILVSPIDLFCWVATLILWTGIAFELPVLIASLVWLGIAGRDRLARLRPYALLAAFVIGAWITPTPDVLNQAIVAVPLYLAYEVGLLLARFVPTRAA